MSEQDIAEFPLPADTTDEERAQAKREIAKHARIVSEEPHLIRLNGTLLGQTGPNWHFQYTRIYALPKGFLAAGHDIREGIKVSYADELDHVADGFKNEGVREFIIDELRFRKVLDAEPVRAH
ncbi:MAG TPA: hypothetical protein DCK98_00950 [Chloroflexi bacterium]|jgi:hypothetical protein|nr:hypothetical protein [Chloroflexota bacterium]HAL25384.1 hypothetical protein [Chloroflexota bacterium]